MSWQSCPAPLTLALPDPAQPCPAHPGTPADSMRLARDTSCDHTSYCHFLRPMTPHSTFPEWIPTLMLMSTPVASLTCLGRQQGIRDLSFSLLLLLKFSIIIHLVQRQDKLMSRTMQLQLINTLLNVDKKTNDLIQYLHSICILNSFLFNTYFIASHMSSPILTQFLA